MMLRGFGRRMIASLIRFLVGMVFGEVLNLLLLC